MGFARVRAARMSYVGGPGFELNSPIKMARHVYRMLMVAGHDLCLLDAGCCALDALRIEQGRRAWGAELRPDETPWEAGLAFSVRLGKSGDFIGKAASLKSQGQPLRKKLVTLVFDTPDAYAWGGEGILLGGVSVGDITSVVWSLLAGVCVALQLHVDTPAYIELRGERVAVTMHDRWPPA